MTHEPTRRPGDNAVSAGPASDAKTFFAAALLTFAAGMIVLMGFMLAGGFGGLLGIVGAGFGIVWWKNEHGKVFPKDLPGSTMLGLSVVSAGLLALVAMMA